MIERQTLRAALAQGTRVLDGGLATELEARGKDLADPLWSARVLLEDEDVLRAVHAAFLDAGAEVLATASYQASRRGFATRGLEAARADALLRRSVTLLRELIEARGSSAWLAASMGSYGATLHDGSEYSGRWDLDEAGLRRFHHQRVAVLIEAEPDLLAFETIPSRAEARAIATVLDDFPEASAWVSLSLRDPQHTGSGERLEELAAELSRCEGVIAIGVNCCPPSWVEPALRRLRAATDRALVAYPNSGEVWNARRRGWEGTAEQTSLRGRSWQEAGARLIGGCCRTRPAAIAALAAELHRM